MRRSADGPTGLIPTYIYFVQLCVRDNYSSFDTTFPVEEINGIIKNIHAEEITQMWKFCRKL